MNIEWRKRTVRLNEFKDYGAYRNAAEGVVRRYDSNGDGVISRSETEQTRLLSTTNETRTERLLFGSDFVQISSVEVKRYAQMNKEAFRQADLNGDGRLSASEMVEQYERLEDSNGNGDLGWFERMGMSAGNLADRLQNFFSNERVLSQSMIYSPLPRYSEPTPPSPDYDRPRPPRPDGGRVTPPSPDFDGRRPSPPSVSRPTPPSPDFDGRRPSPPGVSRPTPPGVSN
jgi:Ca2+-binding EF-hand superfamily protein